MPPSKQKKRPKELQIDILQYLIEVLVLLHDVNDVPGKKYQTKLAIVAIMKNLYLDMPVPSFSAFSPNIPIPSSPVSWEWSVFNNAHPTRFWGQTILAGHTRKRLHKPARPNPVSCVASTRVSENQYPSCKP